MDTFLNIVLKFKLSEVISREKNKRKFKKYDDILAFVLLPLK